jgi:hypothetical protein
MNLRNWWTSLTLFEALSPCTDPRLDIIPSFIPHKGLYVQCLVGAQTHCPESDTIYQNYTWRSSGGEEGRIDRLLGERHLLKGDYSWLVIEQTKANEIHPEFDHPPTDKEGIDQKGRVHPKVDIRTLQPPHEWSKRNGKYAKWVRGADGGLRLRWWTGSKHKEELSIDGTWSMVADF